MITFLTLFLGLVHGPISVALSAPPEVARIELLVDGTKVADLGPPWKATVDLGPELAPHELVGVARGKDGRRLGEARQWVNRARPQAEAAFVLERDRSGRVLAARLVWRCVSSPEPTSVAVLFDGYPVDVKELPRIPIPPHAASVSHLLLADLVFPRGITATAVASFGGQRSDVTEKELTALPVRLTGKAELPKPDLLAGWFATGSRPLEAVAVENGPAEVHFVLAGSARQDLERLYQEDSWPWPWPRPRPLALSKGSRYRFVATAPSLVEHEDVATRLFASSEEYTPEDGTFLRIAANVIVQVPPSAACLAESVAVSALESTVRERRRATVLLLGEGAVDEGPFNAALVRRYLARIRVPVHVWRLAPSAIPAAADWPGAVDASTIEAMGKAFETLRADLASQRIVWIEGRIAPSEVSITEKARGIVEAR